MSVEQESLSDILSGKAPPAVEPVTDVKAEAKAPVAAPSAAEPSSGAKDEPKVEAKAEPEAKSDEAKARDDKGRFQKAVKDPEPMVPLSALLAERAKRREPETPKPKTSFLENEDQAFSERVSEHVNPLKEAVFEMSVEFARGQYEDFDAVAEVFTKAAQNDERLWAQMRDAKNPAKYIYQVGKQFKELAPFGGDVMRYKDHAIAESKTELAKAKERIAALEAENAAAQKSKEALDALPRSLNGSPSGTPKAGEGDPEDIRSIVRFGNSKT